MVKLFKKLDKDNMLPRFMIHCDELARVLSLLGAIGISDERSLSARLESLESGMRKLTESLSKRKWPSIIILRTKFFFDSGS